ncbi:MAG: GNAT family N-acetyltransferase [Bacteroidetes bacterium]|nr:GNAT family N-acetyltransferase [Bacteroidota bacterium]
MSSFSIRFAVSDDAPEIVRLINGLADYERLRHASRPDESMLRKHLASIAVPRVEALVAIDNNSQKFVGFALFYHNYSTFLTNFGLFLEDLFVEEDSRGRGIGLALFKKLAQIADERQSLRLDWNVLNWNEPAISFYKKIGAISLTDWTTMRLDQNAIKALSSN